MLSFYKKIQIFCEVITDKRSVISDIISDKLYHSNNNNNNNNNKSLFNVGYIITYTEKLTKIASVNKNQP